MAWRAMKDFAKSFEDSSWAAACVGPKMRSPALLNASTMPSARGVSGPTTVSAMVSRRANAMRAAAPETGAFSRPGSVAVPPLPGATNTFCTRGLCASFHASACSRPPEPMTRSFIGVASAASMPEVPHAGKNHGDAAFVRRRDYFVVPYAAAWLDHRNGAGLGDDVQSIAERKESVRSDHRCG